METMTEFEKTRRAQQGISRRDFFKRIGAVLAGGALFLSGRLTPTVHAAPPAAPRISSPLVRSTFDRYVGETFTVQSNTLGTATVQLTGVRGAVTAAQADAWGYDNQFTLVFRGTRALSQGTYPLSHPQMGSWNLFIAPGARDGASFTYAAVIHRLPA